MTDTIYILLAISLILAVASMLVPLAVRSGLPYALMLAIAGAGISIVCLWIFDPDLYFPIQSPMLKDAFVGVEKLHLNADLLLPLFLPPLLFAAGLTMDVHRLADEISAVLLLAVVAVLVCIAGVAGAVHLATGVDIVVCLILATVVSTTDPAVVVGIFRDVGAPKRLSILAEGESLLNDAVAIAAFGVFTSILISSSAPDPLAVEIHTHPLSAIGDFVWQSVGGLLLGFAMARGAMAILPRLGGSDAAIASVTMSLTYLSFLVADRYVQVSGVVSVVISALTVAAYGPSHLHPRQWAALRQVWTHLEFWAGCLIFVLASMLAIDVLMGFQWLYAWGAAAVVVGAIGARALVVFGMFPILEAARLVQPVNARYKAILVWGGVRGAVTVVLAMLVAVDQRLPEEARNFIAISATLFVLFTLVVNGVTLGPFLHLLGLDRLSRQEIALRDRIMALSRANVAHRLAQMERAVPGPDSPDKDDSEVPVDELTLNIDERLKIGLVALSLREKELYLSLFDQQILSRRMVARLAAEADRLIDEVRSRAEAGYDAWLERISHPDRDYRLAVWLQRRFDVDWFLKKKLADRFEILMVSQSVLTELAALNLASIVGLLGADIEIRLADIMGRRLAGVQKALAALSLRYPGYAVAVQKRQRERARIRFEAMEYARCLREGVINREIHQNLRFSLGQRRKALTRRPPFDLSLDLANMISRVPIFASLNQEAITEIAKRLRAHVALPGEKLVSKGTLADAMYFVAAGSVTVALPGKPINLKDGDFFGEMGLLNAAPRNADVLSDDFSHLLVLYKKDFHQLLRDQPQVRAEIEAVAKRRAFEGDECGT